jgi:Panthothenate synthetase
MKIFRKASELEPNLVSIKEQGQSIGLVLTMGNLHDGHLSLIREAQLHNEFVICSIFVNPTQFNNEDDFNSYPKTIDNDIFKLENIGCNLLFLPEFKNIF